MEQPEIFPMTPEYLGDAARLERECFSSPWSEAALRETLAGSASIFYVAMLSGKVAGYAGMMGVFGEGYIANVAVSPRFRRRGVGRSLLLALEEYARRNQFSFLTLEVRRSNLPALSLYRQLGYREQGVRPHFYTLPDEDALIMTKFF